VIIMGMADWDLDPLAIKEKLAKAYGQPGQAPREVETITYKTSGVVLNIEPDRKAELQAQLKKVSATLSGEI
jgi:hypothetical protein